MTLRNTSMKFSFDLFGEKFLSLNIVLSNCPLIATDLNQH